MILANCYYVTYQIADFAKNGETTWREDPYQSYDNALLVAKELIKCRDVFDGVCVVDGLTGEVLDEFSADDVIAPTAEKVEEEAASIIGGTFKDKNGGMWHLTDDNKWDYDCTGQNCSDCVYCDKGNCCEILDPLCEEDRNCQIELAKERIAKANKLATIDNSFEDGFGGTWRRDEDNPKLWSYDCYGIKCDECPYNWGSGSCYSDNLPLKKVKLLIEETKERIGK